MYIYSCACLLQNSPLLLLDTQTLFDLQTQEDASDSP